MERSRSEQLKRSKKHKKRKRLRMIWTITAAAAVCAAGVWYWNHERRTGEIGTEKSISSPPAQVMKEVAVVRSPSPASITPSAAIAPSVSPSTTAGAAVELKSPSATDKVAPDGTGLKLAFVGDVIFASTVETLLKQNGYDYPYRELKKELQEPDLTVANLETPITIRGVEEKKKEFTYRSRPEALKAFKESGFDVVNLANNHIMDYGADGLLDTLKYLDGEGILRAGAGKDLKEAYEPVVVSKNGIRTAFLGFSHKVPDNSWKAGTNKPGTTQLYNTKQALEAIAKARLEADLVVVMAHWGEERKDKPLETHRTMAHTFIDAGADLIIGTHPHVMQGFEKYKGKWIAYSLGNFLFTTNNVPATWETIILNAECSRSGDCSLSAVPVSNKFARPIRLGNLEGLTLYDRLTSISYGAKVDAQGRIEAAGAVNR